MENTKRRTGLSKLLSDLAPMDWRSRIDHVWSYYKEIILIGVFMLIFIISMLVNFIGKKDIIMGGILANITLTEEGTSYLTTAYFDGIEEKVGKQEVKLTPVTLGDFEDADSMEMTYYAFTQTLGMLTDAQVDYLIMDKAAMELYISQETFLDLREIFSDQELASWGDRVIKLQKVDANNNIVDHYPIAIDISELDYVQDCVTSVGNVYFGIAVNATNKNSIYDFWEHINNWKDSNP